MKLSVRASASVALLSPFVNNKVSIIKVHDSTWVSLFVAQLCSDKLLSTVIPSIFVVVRIRLRRLGIPMAAKTAALMPSVTTSILFWLTVPDPSPETTTSDTKDRTREGDPEDFGALVDLGALVDFVALVDFRDVRLRRVS